MHSPRAVALARTLGALRNPPASQRLRAAYISDFGLFTKKRRLTDSLAKHYNVHTYSKLLSHRQLLITAEFLQQHPRNLTMQVEKNLPSVLPARIWKDLEVNQHDMCLVAEEDLGQGFGMHARSARIEEMMASALNPLHKAALNRIFRILRRGHGHDSATMSGDARRQSSQSSTQEYADSSQMLRSLAEPFPGWYRVLAPQQCPGATPVVILAIASGRDEWPRTVIRFEIDAMGTDKLAKIETLIYSTTLPKANSHPPIRFTHEVSETEIKMLNTYDTFVSFQAFYQSAWSSQPDTYCMRLAEAWTLKSIDSHVLARIATAFPELKRTITNANSIFSVHGRMVVTQLATLDPEVIPSTSPHFSAGNSEHLTMRLVCASFPAVGSALVEVAEELKLALPTLVHTGFTVTRASQLADLDILSLTNLTQQGQMTFKALAWCSRVSSTASSRDIKFDVSVLVYQSSAVLNSGSDTELKTEVPMVFVTHSFQTTKWEVGIDSDIPEIKERRQSEQESTKSSEFNLCLRPQRISSQDLSNAPFAPTEIQFAGDAPTQLQLPCLDSPEVLTLYSAAVGDHNPIHTQPELCLAVSNLLKHLPSMMSNPLEPPPLPAHGLLLAYRASAAKIFSAPSMVGNYADIHQSHTIKVTFVRPASLSQAVALDVGTQQSRLQGSSAETAVTVNAVAQYPDGTSRLAARLAFTRRHARWPDTPMMAPNLPLWNIFAGQGTATARVPGFPLQKLSNLSSVWESFCALVHQRYGFDFAQAVAVNPEKLAVDISKPQVSKKWETLHAASTMDFGRVLEAGYSYLVGPAASLEAKNGCDDLRAHSESPLKLERHGDSSQPKSANLGVLATSLVQQLAVAGFEVLSYLMTLPLANAASYGAPSLTVPKAAFFAGHSLGELSAIFGALLGASADVTPERSHSEHVRNADLNDLIDAVIARGFVMHGSVPRDRFGLSRTGMVALLTSKLPFQPPQCSELLDQGQLGWKDPWADLIQAILNEIHRQFSTRLNSVAFLELANLNSKGQQYVVAGSHLGLEVLSNTMVSLCQSAASEKGRITSAMLRSAVEKSLSAVLTRAPSHECDPQDVYMPPRAAGRGGVIAMKSVDQPFHTTLFESAIPAFRKLLLPVFSPLTFEQFSSLQSSTPQVSNLPKAMKVSALFGRWYPNVLGGHLFQPTLSFIHKFLDQVRWIRSVRSGLTPRYPGFFIQLQELECRLKALLAECESLNQTAQDAWWHLRGGPMLVVELLSSQVACPVFWSETQNAMLQPLYHSQEATTITQHSGIHTAVGHVSEWSPEPVLLNILKKSLPQILLVDSTGPVILRRDGIAFASQAIAAEKVCAL